MSPYYLPTKLEFGIGKFKEAAKFVKEYGNSALLVTTPWRNERAERYKFLKSEMESLGMKVAVFQGVVPNPTAECVMEGKKIAIENKCDVVVAIGGGSVMDAAKAIAVVATHGLHVWEYFFYTNTQPTAKTLPIITITTTSGTGSQVTKFSVVTKSDENLKSALANDNIFPRIAVVDPELMITMPSKLTAVTGFDAFAHSFESFTNQGASEITDLIAFKAIRLIVENLEKAVFDGNNIEARTSMAWADTYAGMVISNAGTTIPHSLGQPISGHIPKVAHGESLAAVYSAFLKFSWKGAIKKFAAVARIFDPSLKSKLDDYSAEQLPRLVEEWMEKIDCKPTLTDFGVTEEIIADLVEEAIKFPDWMYGPIKPTKDEIIEMYINSF